MVLMDMNTKSMGAMASRLVRWVVLTLAAFAAIGCDAGLDAVLGTTPTTVKYETLAARKLEPVAFVRLYASTWAIVGLDSVHSWFVVKRADEKTVTRYEVWPFYQEDGNGYLWKNLMEPEIDLGEGAKVAVYAECEGEQAEKIIDFLENKRLTYPYRKKFILLPGPNCNTFASWVLKQTGWDIEMPEGAVGKDWKE